MKKYVALSIMILFVVVPWFYANSQPKGITKLKMINFSPYTKSGQEPGMQGGVPESQIISLLDSIKPYTEGIRIYGTDNGLEKIPPLAKQRNLKVYLGIWLGNQPSVNSALIESGINLAKNGYADKIIVGNETLLNNYMTAEQLIVYIDQVKKACPNIPVSYSDVPHKLLENPSVIDHCDFVSVNVYPFWESVPIDCAINSFHQSVQKIISIAKNKPVFISETGWKTEGTSYGEAVPSLPNSVRFLKEALNWSKATGIEVGIFTSFDEPWKIQKSDYGWGIFTNTGSLKKGMEVIFDPITKTDTTWLCKKLQVSGIDTIQVDVIPPIGNTTDDLKGKVNFINPCNYQIASYIRVGNGWWTKPTFTQPAVPIMCNGKWSLDFTTGGNDHLASAMYLFVIPNNYIPPTCNGAASVPAEIFNNDIAYKLISRITHAESDKTPGQITYYPNPVTHGVVTFQIPGNFQDKNAELLIINSDGKVLRKLPISELRREVSVKYLPAGIYQLLMKSGSDKITMTGKLVITL
jgi:glucan 1,3-beta-glucosidase